MIFGAHDLRRRAGTTSAVPLKIIVHNKWNPSVDGFGGDIALLIMEDPIAFTKFIQPICMWNENFEPSATEGIIAGWGFTSHDTRITLNQPKQLKVSVESLIYCVIRNPRFASLVTEKTFCAGAPNNAGACNGNHVTSTHPEGGEV